MAGTDVITYAREKPGMSTFVLEWLFESPATAGTSGSVFPAHANAGQGAPAYGGHLDFGPR
jgi:hypothetical protein